MAVCVAISALTAAASAQPLPDSSQMRLLDVEPPMPEEVRQRLGHSASTVEADKGGASGVRKSVAASTGNSSNAPGVCSGPYVRWVSDDSCWEILPNESYLAVVTRRSSMFTPTGDQVQDWLDSVDGRFQLAWSSLPEPPMPNASAPRVHLRHSTPNATSAPGDLHLFRRAGIGASIERIIDGLVAQRVDDWYFSPLFKTRYNYPGGELDWDYHEFFVPSAQLGAGRWPQVDFRQLMPTLRSLLPSGTRLERTTYRLGYNENFAIYPPGRDGFELLEYAPLLGEVEDVNYLWQNTRGFFLPGDRCFPCGGPSGGPSGGGAAATAIPISSATSRALLVLGLILGGLYWLRRPS